MALFITIGYGDQDGYDRTPEGVRDAAHAHDERLKKAGVRMGIAGEPMQVRNPDGTGARARFGAFSKADLPVAGFGIIELTPSRRRSTWCPGLRARWPTAWSRSGLCESDQPPP